MAWKLTDNFKGHFNRIGHPGKKGDQHPCWKGGKVIDRDGYIRVWKPDHKWPRKGYIPEHVVVMENFIGRKINAFECVHHKDQDRQNNAIENLELALRSEHSRNHRALDKHKYVKDSDGRFVSNKPCGSI